MSDPGAGPDPDILREINLRLARANAEAAELVAELEERSEQLRRSNGNLAQANARSAELVVELQARREELEWTNAHLKQANEDKKRILGVAAHDLRSGVGGIRGLAEMLAEDAGEDPAAVREQACMIQKESQRLLELLENLLDESRAQLGKLELRCCEVDLADLLREAIQVHSLAAEVKGQAIDLRIQDQASRLDADPVRLRQVLDNLLSNAVKYGERSTRITVEVWSEDDQVGVAVLDEGPGLTDEDFGRAFQEFARLSAQPTGGESSHGLGLSIVKRIVEQHGGRIWVENRADRKGARFAFLLPRAKLRDRPCRVLVVDDQVMNRLILKRLLERAGHEVEDVAGGAEAIRAAAEGTHDLVLMDVEMPGVDGLEATRRIRSQGRDEQTLPIIAVTGHSDPAHLSRCLDAGMNDAVTKPVEPGRLELVLRRWAPRRRAATKAA